MNFERHKDPIESMKIGTKRNAINLSFIWVNSEAGIVPLIEKETIIFLRSGYKKINEKKPMVSYHLHIIKNGHRDFVGIEYINNKWILFKGKYYYIENINNDS